MKNDEVIFGLRKWILVRLSRSLHTKARDCSIFGTHERDQDRPSFKTPASRPKKNFERDQSRNRHTVLDTSYVAGESAAERYFESSAASRTFGAYSSRAF